MLIERSAMGTTIAITPKSSGVRTRARTMIEPTCSPIWVAFPVAAIRPDLTER